MLLNTSCQARKESMNHAAVYSWMEEIASVFQLLRLTSMRNSFGWAIKEYVSFITLIFYRNLCLAGHYCNCFITIIMVIEQIFS